MSQRSLRTPITRQPWFDELERHGRYCQVIEDVIGLFLRHTSLMRPSLSPYHRHRFAAEIISHSVWLYFRFTLSFRDVEEMLAMRGVIVSYETVRQWCHKFGQTYAKGLRRRSPRPGDRWHLDEVFLRINGRLHYLWRAVDQDGDVLDILVQSRRDTKAAKKFFRKLLKGLRYVPRVLITDRLKSYSAAGAEAMPGVEHRHQKYQNNRAENSHQPTRLRERAMRRFKSAGHAQRFLSAFGIISSHFRVGTTHLLGASGYKEVMQSRLAVWKEAIAST
jgi:putative transposase